MSHWHHWHPATAACPDIAATRRETSSWPLNPGNPMSALVAFVWMEWLAASPSHARRSTVPDLSYAKANAVHTVLVHQEPLTLWCILLIKSNDCLMFLVTSICNCTLASIFKLECVVARCHTESCVPFQWKDLRGWRALGHRQLHTLLLPAGPDAVLDSQLPCAALPPTSHSRGQLLSSVPR